MFTLSRQIVADYIGALGKADVTPGRPSDLVVFPSRTQLEFALGELPVHATRRRPLGAVEAAEIKALEAAKAGS